MTVFRRDDDKPPDQAKRELDLIWSAVIWILVCLMAAAVFSSAIWEAVRGIR